MFPFFFTYARKVEGEIISLCHCDCHTPIIRGESETMPPRPDADEARLCNTCAEEAFTPWTSIVESLVR